MCVRLRGLQNQRKSDRSANLQVCVFQFKWHSQTPTQADTSGPPDLEKWEAGMKERERGHTSPAAGVPPKPGWHEGQEARADGVCVWGALGLENSLSTSTTSSLAQVVCG